MLESILAADLLTFFLVFCRIGSAMVVLPGFGESYVSPRVRLLFALTVVVVTMPVVAPQLPPMPSGLGLVVPLVGEIGIGLFIGTAARILTSALQTAGTVIAFQINLSSAFVFDPMAGQQGAITSAFLSLVGLTLLFVTDLHHLLLRGLVDSYSVFVPGRLPPIGDFADAVSRLTADSFRIGIQLSAPFLLIGILISVGMGLLARLMPQVQIFAVAPPVQIVTGLFALVLTLSFGMGWFLEWFEDRFVHLFAAT